MILPRITFSDKPPFRNIPTEEETRDLEGKADAWVHLLESYGGDRTLREYVAQNDDDDLAKVFEQALGKFIDERIAGQNSLTSDEVDRLEVDLRREMTRVIRDHLKRTGGNIGHFPYSGERIIGKYRGEELSYYRKTITLSPYELYWPGTGILTIQEDAERYIRAVEVDRKETARQTAAKRRHKIAFFVSAVVFLLTGMTFRLLPSDISLKFLSLFLLSMTVAPVSLILMIRDWRSGKKPVSSSYVTQLEHERKKFVRSATEIHEYCQFMKLWAERTGRPLPENKMPMMNGFYRSMEPFTK